MKTFTGPSPAPRRARNSGGASIASAGPVVVLPVELLLIELLPHVLNIELLLPLTKVVELLLLRRPVEIVLGDRRDRRIETDAEQDTD